MSTHAHQNAAPPQSGGRFQPFVPDSKIMPEFTLKSVLLGAMFGVIFGASTVYLALKAGLTVSASIPIAVLAISLGVACPREGCGGFIAEKRSRRGKPFYGCSNYAKTKCDFVLWDRPLPQPCPSCGAKFLVKRVSRRGTQIRCVTEGCGYSSDGEAPEPPATHAEPEG